MHVYLIGMPGAGKTTLGRQLAAESNCPFVDLDEAIEIQTGLRIPEIFEQKGEAFFRQAEKESLETVSSAGKKLVIATGGGTPCFFENLSFMQKNGTLVYLKTDLNILVQRLLNQQVKGRPLLSGKTPDELLTFLSQTFTAREPFYLQAGIIFEAGKTTNPAGELAQLIGQTGEDC